MLPRWLRSPHDTDSNGDERGSCGVSPPALEIRPGLVIPLSEIELRTSRSSGPGGQHANVTASRVEAVFDVAASSALSDGQRARISAKLGPRVTASAQDTRSQSRNRDLALERLAARLAGALETRRPRTPTRPTTASKRRRLETKRRRSETKKARRRPSSETP
jgi:ribosome-associated protein